jgi:hypothetical protein
MSLSAPFPVTTLVAGSQSSLLSPFGLWGDGPNLYVTTLNQLIQKVLIATATVTTLAGNDSFVSGADDGRGSLALFSAPTGIWGDGNNLYVADFENSAIRKLSPLLAAPSVTSVFPTSVTSPPTPSVLTVGLTGDNFDPVSTRVSISGATGVTVGAVNVANRTTMTVDLNLNGGFSGGGISNFNLKVTTTAGTSAQSVTFTVLEP